MDDATTITTKSDNVTVSTNQPPSEGSSLFNVSVRGWLTLIVFLTASYMAVRGLTITEPYYSLVFLVAGFYFGQASKPKTQT